MHISSGTGSLNRSDSSHVDSTLHPHSGSLNRLGSLNRTGTGKYISRLGDRHHAGTGSWIKNGLVTTAEGFFTSSTGTAKDLARNIASSLASLWDHLSSRLLRSSEVGLLLDFFLLGFGESSHIFFFPAGVVSVLFPAFSPSTRPNSVTSYGSTRVGVVDTGEAWIGCINAIKLYFNT